MSQINGGNSMLYRYAVEIKAYGHKSVKIIDAHSEAEALRIAQKEIGYEWKITPRAFAKYDEDDTYDSQPAVTEWERTFVTDDE